jgi:hypothetical protein
MQTKYKVMTQVRREGLFLNYFHHLQCHIRIHDVLCLCYPHRAHYLLFGDRAELNCLFSNPWKIHMYNTEQKVQKGFD